MLCCFISYCTNLMNFYRFKIKIWDSFHSSIVLYSQAFALFCLSFLLMPYNVLLSEILPVLSDLMCFWIFCSRKLYCHFTLYHRILLAIIHVLFWSETDQNLKIPSIFFLSIFTGNFHVSSLRALLMSSLRPDKLFYC